jgi:transcriptional regulator with XRE-family HTH domain
VYNPILVNPTVIRPLIGRVRSALVYSQRRLGEALGISKRTVLRWEGGQAVPADFKVADMARLVYARDRELARELAAALGKSLVDLGIEAPALPPPAPKAPALGHLVDSVLCAAAEAATIPPHAMRGALLAAFDRMAALELTTAQVAEGLGGAKTTRRQK